MEAPVVRFSRLLGQTSGNTSASMNAETNALKALLPLGCSLVAFVIFVLDLVCGNGGALLVFGYAR